jgi:hypothetical protein
LSLIRPNFLYVRRRRSDIFGRAKASCNLQRCQ